MTSTSEPVELTAPDGTPIKATYEAVTGAEAAVISVLRHPDGSVEPEHQGGTDTDSVWDGMETVEVRGETVYLDEGGDAWRESQLIAAGEPEREEEAPLVLPSYNELLALVHEVHDLLLRSVGENEAVDLIRSRVST